MTTATTQTIAIGAQFITLLGETDTDEHGNERQTASGAVGTIKDLNHGTGAEATWDLVYENGAWVCPTTAELLDPKQYQRVA